MKHIYTLLMVMAVAFSSQGQVVFSSDLSSWASNLPIDFVGTRTNINTDSISETMVNVNAGTSAANLLNASGTHKRFTTQPLAVVSGEAYDITFWVRGEGEIRTGLYDGRPGGSSGYAPYNSYSNINSTTWQQVTQTVTCANDTAAGEFILSIRNTAIGIGLDIDSVVISLGFVGPPTTTSIYAIQFTMDPSGDSPLLGGQVITGGVVSQVDSSGYFIQENEAAWSGIYVFDSSMPARGDSVEVEGTVAEYFNSTQIGTVTSYTNFGPVGSPVPVVASTAAANLEEWESVLIQVTGNCTDDDISNNFGQWKLDDGSGEIWIDDLYYDYVPSMGLNYRVTGPATYSFSERKILPRDMDDVEVIISVEEIAFPALRAFPIPANTNLTIDLGGNHDRVQFALSDVSGRVLNSGQMSGRIASFDMRDFANGQYALRLVGLDGQVRVVPFMVQR